MKRTTALLWAPAGAIFLIAALPGFIYQESSQSKPKRIVGNAFRPERRDFTRARLSELKAPAGFQIRVFAEGLGNPRMMAVADDGTVYVTRPDQSDVIALKDSDSDGTADPPRAVVSNLKNVHAIALRGDRLYLAYEKKVWTADLKPDGTASEPQVLISDLANGGQHAKRSMAFGPDNKLYISVGSTCNACVESDDENATLVQMQPDGKERKVFAKGLRNVAGFAWHPTTGELWGMDHGTDWLGDNEPPEELNRITEGGDYGWPYVHGKGRINDTMNDPKGMTKAEYAAKTLPSTLDYQAHSAPIGMIFYTGSQFPAQYRNDAFVAMRGSWNRVPASGYKVVRIRFQDGKPVRFEDFLTGFLIDNGRAHFGRVAGVAIAKDGSLLVSEDANGVVYRIVYVGDAREASSRR